MQKQYAVITRPSEPSQIVDANFVYGKTVYQIIQDLHLQNETLFITTPFIRWPLLYQSIPSNDYPQIIINENPGKFTRPEYYLTILPIEKQYDLVFYVKVQSQPAFDIPPFEVSIQYRNEYTMNVNYFLQCAIQQFQLEATNYHLLLDCLPASGEVSLLKLMRSNFVLFCTLTEKAQYIIRTRINIVNEIQTTEKTYLNGLHHLYNDWRKELIANRMITDQEDTQIFKTFPSIILCHESFLKSIEERAEDNPYGAMYSDIFLDFANYFKISLNYISNYHKIISVITQKEKHKDWTRRLNDLELKLGSLSNYLITPVQRMPRYILFLRELIKFTPPSHPDSELLKSADQSMREIANQINNAATIAENENKVFMIHKSVENINLLEASRTFIAQFQINFTRNSTYIATLYVFNDLILITRKDKGSEKEVFHSHIFKFRYSNYFFNKIIVFEKSSSFMKKSLPIIIEFSTKKEKQSFDSLVFKEKIEICNLKKLSDKLFGFSPLPDESTLYLYDVLSGCDCCSTEKGIFTFVGTKILWYNIFTNKIDFIPTRLDQRTNYSLNYIEENHTLYMFGGINKTGEANNEIWTFNIETMKEDFILAQHSPEARYGHSAVVVRNMHDMKEGEPVILIFGGISKKKKYLNDICAFNPFTNKWSYYSTHKNCPCPRAFHSAAVFNKNNKNVMYVYGGEEKGEYFSDFFSLNLSTLQWRLISLNQLERRAYHRSIVIGDDLIILGGLNNSNYLLKPLIIHTEDETSVLECVSGLHDPPILKDFGIAAMNDNIFLFTGERFGGKFTSNTIYKVTPPPIIDMRQSIHIFNNPNYDMMKFNNPPRITSSKSQQINSSNNNNNSIDDLAMSFE